MESELLVDVGYVLQASKRLDYKERVRGQVSTFITYLQDNDLTKNTLISEEKPLQDNLKVYESDLTKNGVIFFDKVFLKWSGRVDKGGDPFDSIYLEKEFKKLKL